MQAERDHLVRRTLALGSGLLLRLLADFPLEPLLDRGALPQLAARLAAA